MPKLYAGTHQMLCPYYIKRTEKGIKCVCPEEWIRFASRAELEQFMKHNCYFAAPMGCERYAEHRRLVEEGEEKPLKPRASMDTKWKDYHTEWMRKRREDPNYKW